MTAKEIFELRKLGCKEEAYDAVRILYASDKSPLRIVCHILDGC